MSMSLMQLSVPPDSADVPARCDFLGVFMNKGKRVRRPRMSMSLMQLSVPLATDQRVVKNLESPSSRNFLFPQHQIHQLQTFASQKSVSVWQMHEARAKAVKQVLHELSLLA